MNLPESGEQRIRKSNNGYGPVWRGTLGISLVGAVLGTGSIYLCHYVFVRDLSPASPAALAAGLGLIGAFCVLTLAAFIGIRQMIIDPGARFQPAAALAIALICLTALIGLLLLGLRT